jgi:hypothetical protein
MFIYHVEIQHIWIFKMFLYGDGIYPMHPNRKIISSPCVQIFFLCKLQIYQAERKDTLGPGRMEELGGEMDPPLPREIETCGPEMDLLLPETWMKLNHSTITAGSNRSVLETG